MIVQKNKDWSGRLLIDGLDAYLVYGIFVLDENFKAVVQKPSFKKVESTEWKECDGVEVDLTDPTLDSRTLQIEFGMTDLSGMDRLIMDLSDGAYHTFFFADLQRSYRLRLTQNDSINSYIRLGKVKLTFADDFPEVARAEPKSQPYPEVKQRSYMLDDVDFSRCGVWVLDGTDDNIRKAPQVRSALSVNLKTESGVIYDAENVRYKSMDATLKCLVHADSIEDFWRRYDSLFAILMQPDERKFYFAPLDKTFSCYYKSSSVSKFKIFKNGHVWCEFSVVLCFTGDGLIPEIMYALLTTESGENIVLEGEETAIKILPTN